jgi:predicted small lipoprotein YifL
MKGSPMRFLMIALAALFFLSACGKKAPLRPPGATLTASTIG